MKVLKLNVDTCVHQGFAVLYSEYKDEKSLWQRYPSLIMQRRMKQVSFLSKFLFIKQPSLGISCMNVKGMRAVQGHKKSGGLAIISIILWLPKWPTMFLLSLICISQCVAFYMWASTVGKLVQVFEIQLEWRRFNDSILTYVLGSRNYLTCTSMRFSTSDVCCAWSKGAK